LPLKIQIKVFLYFVGNFKAARCTTANLGHPQKCLWNWTCFSIYES